jgi:hypothetical protein
MDIYKFLNNDAKGSYDADEIFAEPDDSISFKSEEESLVDDEKSDVLNDFLGGDDT